MGHVCTWDVSVQHRLTRHMGRVCAAQIDVAHGMCLGGTDRQRHMGRVCAAQIDRHVHYCLFTAD